MKSVLERYCRFRAYFLQSGLIIPAFSPVNSIKIRVPSRAILVNFLNFMNFVWASDENGKKMVSESFLKSSFYAFRGWRRESFSKSSFYLCILWIILGNVIARVMIFGMQIRWVVGVDPN